MRLVFDLGGVVCTFHPDARRRALAEASALDEQIVEDRIWASGLDERAELGLLTRAETYRAVRAALDDRLDEHELRHAWASAFEPDSRVIDLVRAVEGPVALLTNNGPIVEDCVRHELAVVGSAFTDIFFSWRLRACKPDVAAFERVAENLLCDPGELVLIDDSIANVDTARACGWLAIHYTDPERLLGSLSNQSA